MKIILGSSSPRRKEILSYYSIPFVAISPNFDEEAIPFKDIPEEFVRTLSKGKAESLVQQYPEAIIISADTIVYRNGKVYGKPTTLDEALTMFSELSGEWHTVYTSITVRKSDVEYTQEEATKVLFNPLTEDQIRHYLSHATWSDKAGGYAIQGVGGLIVRRIEGCYYNVMGLPVNTLEFLLRKLGIELWDHL